MSDCEYALTDIPARYLQGSLDAAGAESFEQHYFACERCWNELEIGMAVRRRTFAGRRARRRSFAIPLSIAAAVVVVMTSTWVFISQRVPEERPVYRGTGTTAITLTTSVAGNKRVITWKPVAGAASYTITLFAADGSELQRTSTTATSLTLPPSGRMFTRIDAFDSDGNRIASSSLQPLEATE